MKKLPILSLLFLLLIMCSCSKGGDDDTMNPPPNNVTYIGAIKMIIDNNCNSCHSDPPINGAPMSLISYNDVKNATTDRGLINRVESGSMPSNGNKLSDAQIQAIKDWQTGGFKEN